MALKKVNVCEQTCSRPSMISLPSRVRQWLRRCTLRNREMTIVPINTHDPKIQATRNTSYLTASKSLNGRKIARMAPILTIFGPNRSQRRNLFFEKFSNERRRHRGIVVIVIVAVVVAVVVIGRFWVACIKGTSLLPPWQARQT